MMKILFIPHYFPTKESEIIGSQIKEQLEFINDEFEIKVLYCTPGIGIAKYIASKTIFKPGKKNFYNTNDLKSGILDAYGLKYFQPFFLDESIRFKLKYSAYESAMADLVNNGWLPDLIHCRTIIDAGFIAERLSKKYNVPYKITENTFLLINEQTTEFIIKNYVSSVRNCSGLSVVSNKLADFFITNNLNQKPYLLPNFIDDSKFTLKKQTPKKNRILFVGYNSYIKDLQTFFKALNHLKYLLNFSDFEVKFCLTQIFDTEDLEQIKKMTIKELVDDLIEILPMVERSEMPLMYQNASVFVSTSVAETFGISCLEAMFCGTPVLAIDNGGVRDFITEQNGILMDKYDFKSLANSLFQIFSGSLTFPSVKVRESVEKKYSKKYLKQKLKDFYIQK